VTAVRRSADARVPPLETHHHGREGENAPSRHAITNAARTVIAATKNTITRQISDRSAAREWSLGIGVGIVPASIVCAPFVRLTELVLTRTAFAASAASLATVLPATPSLAVLVPSAIPCLHASARVHPHRTGLGVTCVLRFRWRGHRWLGGELRTGLRVLRDVGVQSLRRLWRCDVRHMSWKCCLWVLHPIGDVRSNGVDDEP
jgi:hypothetical protein